MMRRRTIGAIAAAAVALFGAPALAEDPPEPGPESDSMSVTIEVTARPLELRINPTNITADGTGEDGAGVETDSTDIVWEFFPSEDSGGYGETVIDWDVDVRTDFQETTRIDVETPGLADTSVLEDLTVAIGMYIKALGSDDPDIIAIRGPLGNPTGSCNTFFDTDASTDDGPRSKRMCTGLLPGFDSITGANGSAIEIQHYLVGTAPSQPGVIRLDYTWIISVESNGD